MHNEWQCMDSPVGRQIDDAIYSKGYTTLKTILQELHRKSVKFSRKSPSLLVNLL